MAIQTLSGNPAHSFTDDQGHEYRLEGSSYVRNFVEEERLFWREVTEVLEGDVWRTQLAELISWGLTSLEFDHPYGQQVRAGELRAGDPLTSEPVSSATEKFEQTIQEYRMGIRPTRTSSFADALQRASKEKIMARRGNQMRQHIASFLLSNFSPDLKGLAITAREEAQALHNLLGVAKNANEEGKQTLAAVAKQMKDVKEEAGLVAGQVEVAQGLLKNFPERLKKECTDTANDAAAKASATVLADKELREPQTYWSDRQDLHAKTRFWFMWGFFALCVAAGIVIPLIAYHLFGDKVAVAYENWTVAFALLGAPGLLAVWIIRMAGKVYATHQALETDAAERVTMMKAFVALNASNKLTADDKHLILKALFRPSQHVAEEEPMPSWIDAVFSRVGTKAP